jgi:hypothetical protein
MYVQIYDYSIEKHKAYEPRRLKLLRIIQNVSGGIVNILGGGTMNYSELISSY